MRKTYQPNETIGYVPESNVDKNCFINMQAENEKPPRYETAKDILPEIIWDGHPDAIACYNKAWEIAFGNIMQPVEGSGFVSNFIDTAFNGAIFMWDSSFIMLFAKYGVKAFNFQKTLDNFYARQHKDGFISRSIFEHNGGDAFTRYDPVSTGPNIMGWAEWEYYKFTGDKSRLEKVYYPLLAYHNWMKQYRTWRDGTYWSSGWGCGMDNIPRFYTGKVENTYDAASMYSHGHMVWIDACFQAVLSAENLILFAKEIGDTENIQALEEEVERLNSYINDNLWDEDTGYYYDLLKNGQLNGVKSVAPYWGLLSGSVKGDRLEKMVSHLEDKTMFNRPHRVPALSADNVIYVPTGGYWRGGVWAPTTYMVLSGLQKNGYDRVAYDIALNHLENILACFKETNTLWETYQPEFVGKPGSERKDFVGWTGLVPIAVLIEFVFGIQINAAENKIIWTVNRTEKHGIDRLPFGDQTISLMCQARADDTQVPEITVKCEKDAEIEIRYSGKSVSTTLFALRDKGI